MTYSQKGISTVLVIAIIMLVIAGTTAIYFLQKPAPAPEIAGPTKEFNIVAKSYSYSPSEIKVNKGDKVKLNVFIADGFHDLVIDEFNAQTERISAMATTTVEFVADKAGNFKYYCSIGGHRQLGMEGTLIVEAN